MTNIIIQNLGLTSYHETWQFMKDYTNKRTASTPDQLWVVEHSPVFTQGQAGKPEHLLDPGDITVIQTDRGGQITYHGPGQLIIYVLVDLKRRNLGVKSLISILERSIIALLAQHKILGHTLPKAPGVYVNNCKIASLGLRIRRGCSYHGLSLNVNMNLEPFRRINPCGYPGLKVVQMRDFIPEISTVDIGSQLLKYLIQDLNNG